MARDDEIRTAVSVSQLDASSLRGLGDEWRELEVRAGDPSPFVCFDWLSAWARVYEPASLQVVRVADRDGRLIAAGLVEVRAGGRWRFAGRPTTPERGLLCEAAAEETAWRAVWRWMLALPRGWSALDAEGVRYSGALPGGRRRAAQVYELDAGGSFDDYLRGRSSNMRSSIRRHRRRLDEAGGVIEPVAPAELAEAFETFVALHARRAREKGERHPAIDARLARMLAELAASGGVRVGAHALKLDGRVAGVVVHLRHGRTLYYYNLGWDPAAAGFSPGILLVVACIELAFEEGYERVDLGPGAEDYKLSLGGRETPRWDLELWSPSLVGRAFRVALEGYRLTGRLRADVRNRDGWSSATTPASYEDIL